MRHDRDEFRYRVYFEYIDRRSNQIRSSSESVCAGSEGEAESMVLGPYQRSGIQAWRKRIECRGRIR